MKRLRSASRATPCCFEGEVVRRSGRFAVVSDLQRTSRAEIWRESNRDERQQVLEEIARERPDFLAVLGDLVFRGSSSAEWEELDRVCAPLREACLPVLPVLGNHEYWISRRGALDRFFARFPHLGKRHWYSIPYGPIGLVSLDSNLR
jgi:3',5'-cyclic AMP phosphodiesterase CpdA